MFVRLIAAIILWRFYGIHCKNSKDYVFLNDNNIVEWNRFLENKDFTTDLREYTLLYYYYYFHSYIVIVDFYGSIINQ